VHMAVRSAAKRDDPERSRRPSRFERNISAVRGYAFVIIRRQNPNVPMEQALTRFETMLASELATIERVIDFVARRHHLRGADAADFASHVKMKLVEDDYAILRKFQGRSSLRTYLVVVVQRLFLDCSIAKWGKWRPSAEAKRAGNTGIILERLLWRDGYSFDEACEILATNHHITVSRAELDRIAAALPARPGRRFESDMSLQQHVDTAAGADVLSERRERTAFAERVAAILKRLLARLEPEDRLILVMRFVDGHSVADIASLLRIEQKRLYRRLDRLLRDLREGFRAEGIAAEDALAIFDDPTISLDW
jgi:RNA polymerase sigma factor (sigma-70 family)